MKIKGIFVVVLCLFGCSRPVERLIRYAQQKENQEDYFRAVEFYEFAIKKMDLENDPTQKNNYLIVTEKLADLNTYHLANPKTALHWLKKRREWLTDRDELVRNQKKIVKLYIDFLSDFEQAVVEAQGLLGYDFSIEEKCSLFLDLGLALYQLKRLEEAKKEISQCLGNIPLKKELAYKLAVLEIDILISEKRYQDVIYQIENYKKIFYDLDVDQDLKLTQALSYEEIQDFYNARQILNELLMDTKYNDKGYIKLRLERLKQKELQQAGLRLKAKPK